MLFWFVYNACTIYIYIGDKGEWTVEILLSMDRRGGGRRGYAYDKRRRNGASKEGGVL